MNGFTDESVQGAPKECNVQGIYTRSTFIIRLEPELITSNGNLTGEDVNFVFLKNCSAHLRLGCYRHPGGSIQRGFQPRQNAIFPCILASLSIVPFRITFHGVNSKVKTSSHRSHRGVTIFRVRSKYDAKGCSSRSFHFQIDNFPVFLCVTTPDWFQLPTIMVIQDERFVEVKEMGYCRIRKELRTIPEFIVFHNASIPSIIHH
jgi:hypothetical protein